MCPQDIISSRITPYTSLFKSDENFLIAFRGRDGYHFSQEKQLGSPNGSCHQRALQSGTEKDMHMTELWLPSLHLFDNDYLNYFVHLYLHFVGFISVYTDILIHTTEINKFYLLKDS